MKRRISLESIRDCILKLIEKARKITMDYSLIISCIALIISGLNFYKDSLDPFKLDIHPAGRITISNNPFSEALSQDCVTIDLIFTNQGARQGIVEDVALVIRSNDRFGVFRSLVEEGDRSLHLQKELLPPKFETFIGFQLTKAETKIHRILFVHYKNDISQFLVGTYQAEVFVKSSESKEWIRKNSINFTISPQDAITFNNSISTPQPQGGIFVNLRSIDIVLDEEEEALKKLYEIVANQK